jgi:hypothetical protein
MGHTFVKLGWSCGQVYGCHAGRKSEPRPSELCWLVVVDQEALGDQ